MQLTGPTADGSLAVVLMPDHSANGKSTVTMQLWLEPDMITKDT